MAAGTTPIYVDTPNVSWTGAITAANTALDGTGTTVLGFTAGADGAFVERVHIEALGTNVATVARIFLNNGQSPATAANNVLVAQIGMSSSAASNQIPTPYYDYPLNWRIPASYRLYVAIGTAVAAGYNFTFFGGDY